MGFPNFRQFRKELEDQPDTQTLGLVVQKNLDAGNEELISFLQQAGFNADGTFNNLTVNNLTVNNITNNPAANAVGLLRATRTFSQSQIAVLDSTPFQLLTPAGLGTAPGVGFAIHPAFADWTLNTVSASFGNIASDLTLQITLGADATSFGQRFMAAQLAPDFGIQRVSTGMFEPAKQKDIREATPFYENEALYCFLANGLGALTGGTGATLLVNVYYVITPVMSGVPTNTIVYTTTARKVEPPAANRIAVTPSATANAFSNWFEIDSATVADWALAAVAFNPNVATNVYVEFQVGVGAAGSEVPVGLIGGQLDAEATCSNHRLAWMIPIGGRIHSGDRVAVRMRKSGTNTANWTVALEYFEEPMAGNAVVSPVIGDVSGQIALSPSGTDNTLSAWFTGIEDAPLATDIVAGAAVVSFNPVDEAYELTVGPNTTPLLRSRGFPKDISALGGGGLWHNICYPALPVFRAGSNLTMRMRKNNTDTSSWFAKLMVYKSAAFPLLTTELPNLWYPDTGDTLVGLNVSGTPWANGSYTVLFTTTKNITITHALVNIDTTSPEIEIDIATGTPGNEVVQTRVRLDTTVLFSGCIEPISLVIGRNISAGEIISMRCRASAVAGIAAGISYIESPDFYQRLDTVSVCYPSAANAVTVAGHGTAWNNSNYVELVAQTATAVYLTHLNYNSNGVKSIDVEFDLASGGASSEVVIGTFTTYIGATSQFGTGQIAIVPPIKVTTNTRIAVRFRKTGTDTTSWKFSAVATPV